jgi:hypothetical protein
MQIFCAAVLILFNFLLLLPPTDLHFKDYVLFDEYFHGDNRECFLVLLKLEFRRTFLTGNEQHTKTGFAPAKHAHS